MLEFVLSIYIYLHTKMHLSIHTHTDSKIPLIGVFPSFGNVKFLAVNTTS